MSEHSSDPSQPPEDTGTPASGSYGAAPSYSTGQPYGTPASYGTGQAYGTPASYGGDQTLAYGQPPAPSRPPAPRRAGLIVGILAGALVVSMCSAVTGGVIGAWTNQQLRDPAPDQTTVVDGPRLDRASLASIASEVHPSVVSVRAGQGEGSGVVMDDQGHIITNAHVVEAASGPAVEIRSSTGEIRDATVVGGDARSDIAVVRAEDTSGLTTAQFGDSGEVLVGDTVLAIGSPLGYEGSVTQGIVSARDRVLDAEPGGSSLSGLLQTDAAINRGNSGGALVNLAGEVVGINTAIAVENRTSGFLGVGFAVPSNRAVDVADQLIAGGEVQHAFMGVSILPAADGGALIGEVVSGSPADEAGLQVDDVVVRLGERQITDADDLVSAVQSSAVGETLEVEYLRDGVTRTTSLTLGDYED